MASKKESQSQLHANSFWTRAPRAERTTHERLPVGSIAMCGRTCQPCRISSAGSGNNDGVTPEQAPVTIGVGAVVGDGDVPGFGDCGLRQRCAQAPVGVARVGQVVHDVFAAIRDAYGDRTVGQESAARDQDLAAGGANDGAGRSDRPVGPAAQVRECQARR